MRLKKILTGLLSATILIAVLCSMVVTASASAETATVSVSDAAVSAGESVSVELSMSAKGVAGFQGELRYDKEALELEGITETAGIGSGGMFMFSQDEATKTYKNGSFFYASASGADFDGVILTFTFRANGNANGKYKFSVEGLSVYDGTAGSPQALQTKIQNAGSITVGAAGFNPLILAVLLVVVLLVVAVVFFVIAKKNKARPHYYREAQADFESDDEE